MNKEEMITQSKALRQVAEGLDANALAMSDKGGHVGKAGEHLHKACRELESACDELVKAATEL